MNIYRSRNSDNKCIVIAIIFNLNIIILNKEVIGRKIKFNLVVEGKDMGVRSEKR